MYLYVCALTPTRHHVHTENLVVHVGNPSTNKPSLEGPCGQLRSSALEVITSYGSAESIRILIV